MTAEREMTMVTHTLKIEGLAPGTVKPVLREVMDVLGNPDAGNIEADLWLELSLSDEQAKTLEAYFKGSWIVYNLKPRNKGNES